MGPNKSFTLGSARNERAEPLDRKDAKWLDLRTIHWTDEEGRARKWETYGRGARVC